MQGPLLWMLYLTVVLSLASQGHGQTGLLNVTMVEESYCNTTRTNVLNATHKVQAKIITLPSVDQYLSQLFKSLPFCSLWVVKSGQDKGRVKVTISDLEIPQNDIFFVVSDESEVLFSQNVSSAVDSKFDQQSRDFSSSSSLTLIWVHRSRSTGNTGRKDHVVAFSFMLFDETEPEPGSDKDDATDKESFILSAAIIVSIVAILATLASVLRVRGRYCCKCLFASDLKWSRQTRSTSGSTTYDRPHHTDNSRVAGSGEATQEESIMLMELHTSAANGNGVILNFSPAHASDASDVHETLLRHENGSDVIAPPPYDSIAMSSADNDPCRRDVHGNGDQDNVDDQELLPSQTWLSPLLGNLPSTSEATPMSGNDSVMSRSGSRSGAVTSTTAANMQSLPPVSSSRVSPAFPSSIRTGAVMTLQLPSSIRDMLLSSSSSFPLTSSSPSSHESTTPATQRSEPRGLTSSSLAPSIPSPSVPIALRVMQIEYAPSSGLSLSVTPLQEALPPPYVEPSPPSYLSLYPEANDDATNDSAT